MKKLALKAFAKINLGLRVFGRRADGYHEIETLLQSVDLHDTLTLTIQKQPGIELKIASPWPIVEGRENLAHRAAALITSRVGAHGRAWGVRISLEKRIPVGAGLGGGSSDAAATLVGLNKLLQLKLGAKDLHQMACALGSDVPYFLLGGLCHGRGRGEILQKLEARFDGYTFLLLKPDFSLSTEAVYREFDLLIEQGWRPPSVQLSHKLDCGNDLEEAALRLCPELHQYRRALAELGPDFLGLSGSGPTYYAGWRSEKRAAQAAQELLQKGCSVYLARPTETGSQITKELAEKAKAD